MVSTDAVEWETVPYEPGRSFGAAGPAVLRRFRVGHAVDPADPGNATIADLAWAERDAAGKVRIDHDVVVVQPADPAARNGWALVDVVNRGRPTAPTYLLGVNAPPYPVPPQPHAGDGWLLAHGWTVVYAGWQFDVDDPTLLGLRAPAVRPPGGSDLRDRVCYEVRPSVPSSSLPLTSPGHRLWPAAADPRTGPAVLSADGEVVPDDRWEFVPDRNSLRWSPSAQGRFEPGVVYRFDYEATGAVVTGAGLLALREVAGWLRAAEGIDRTLLFGVSQSGRLIRQFLADGCNVDPVTGAAAYDAMLPLTAGGRVGQFNRPFTVPGTLPNRPEEVPVDATYRALLVRSDAAGASPKVIALNTSNEYWRGDAALLHGETHPDVRVHHLAGTQHTHGTVPQLFEVPVLGWRGRHGFNVVDWRPVVRAAVVQLVDWVERDVPAEPSRLPSEEQLTDRATVLGRFEAMGRVVPRVGSFPEPAGVVTMVDEVGNEVGGLRLPDVAAPIGVHTGWNVRHPDTGAPEDELLLTGASWWFDDLPPLDAHLAATREVAVQLVADRFLLAEDVDAVIEGAEARWREAEQRGAAARPGPEVEC